MSQGGVWAVWYTDWHRFLIAVFPESEELEARRYLASHWMGTGGARVDFLPFGVDFSEWSPDESGRAVGP